MSIRCVKILEREAADLDEWASQIMRGVAPLSLVESLQHRAIELRQVVADLKGKPRRLLPSGSPS